jgi:hypothetical protein
MCIVIRMVSVLSKLMLECALVLTRPDVSCGGQDLVTCPGRPVGREPHTFYSTRL